MALAPVGFFGKVAASRPVLVNGLFAIGLMALAVSGANARGGGATMIIFGANALYVVAAPLAVAAFQPRKRHWRLFYGLVVAAALGVLVFADLRPAPRWAVFSPPPAALTFAAAGFAAFLIALSPIVGNVARLASAAPVAAMLGAVGGLGYAALELRIDAAESAVAAGLALALGIAVGTGVGADFGDFFARGESRSRAAAAAGHASTALGLFSMLTVAALFCVQTFETNFGAVEWRVLWAAFAAALLAGVAALFAVAGALALAPLGERIAVNENRRRQWFRAAWRPVRRVLPPATANGVAAVAFILVVIALFETGFPSPLSVGAFFFLIWAAAALVFVSLRASLLVLLLLAFSAPLAGYAYGALGLDLPDRSARLAALALCAVAVGPLAVSWRNAGDFWRNARDVTENALSAGLPRFVMIMGAGAASLFVSAYTFGWREGYGAVLYFMATAFASLLLAPAMMTMLSGWLRRY